MVPVAEEEAIVRVKLTAAGRRYLRQRTMELVEFILFWKKHLQKGGKVYLNDTEVEYFGVKKRERIQIDNKLENFVDFFNALIHAQLGVNQTLQTGLREEIRKRKVVAMGLPLFFRAQIAPKPIMNFINYYRRYLRLPDLNDEQTKGCQRLLDVPDISPIPKVFIEAVIGLLLVVVDSLKENDNLRQKSIQMATTLGQCLRYSMKALLLMPEGNGHWGPPDGAPKQDLLETDELYEKRVGIEYHPNFEARQDHEPSGFEQRNIFYRMVQQLRGRKLDDVQKRFLETLIKELMSSRVLPKSDNIKTVST